MGVIAGKLNEVIKVLKETRITTDYGDTTVEYQFKFYCRANQMDKYGNRAFVNDEILYVNTKQFEVRYYQDIQNTDIIEWYGNRYRIISISPDRKNQRKVITVELINE